MGHRVWGGRGPHGQGSPTKPTKQRLWNLFLFFYITAGAYQRGICCQDSGKQKVYQSEFFAHFLFLVVGLPGLCGRINIPRLHSVFHPSRTLSSLYLNLHHQSHSLHR